MIQFYACSTTNLGSFLFLSFLPCNNTVFHLTVVLSTKFQDSYNTQLQVYIFFPYIHDGFIIAEEKNYYLIQFHSFDSFPQKNLIYYYFQSTAQKGPTSLNEISLSSLLTYLIQLGICLLKFGSLQGSHSFYIFLQYTSSPEVLFYIIGRSKNMH